ncbi:MAG: hypothetical protein QOJ46_544 [bacterium]
MPLKNYGVLRGSVVDHQLASGRNPHFQLHVVAAAMHLRIAINVKSDQPPSDLEYLIDSNFRHPVLDAVAAQPEGWNVLERKPGGAALDFIRGNLFNRDDFVKLPFDVPGPDNDLNEKLLHYVTRAIGDEEATLFAFGERWGPVEPVEQTTDKIFGFGPDDGVHDIHMNQSNVGDHKRDNGVYQDGALLLHFPLTEQWVAIFLKFQSQTWHSDDVTGDLLPQPGDAPDGRVRIAGALVNAVETPETEFVTLLNTTAAAIDLAGWQLVDRNAHTMSLQGTLAAGETLRVQLTPQVALPNRGGTISLLDAAGLKVDGVAYTGEQAAEPGRTIAF